jgi:FMN-dependent oxidoreductase (nitrilotriacetate monooxygenase family)
MTKEIRINGFAMNCAGHLSPGLWTHPRDGSASYNDIDYWTDLAKIFERGKFDAMFLADVLGVYDVYQGSVDAALRHGAQVPVNDPAIIVPAMAQVTKNLCFTITATVSFEPPYPFARRMSTLDHVTRGRIGWNIVTGYLDSAAKGSGQDQQTGHDRRYDIADEYMDVVYKLWEGSWAEDAVVRDRASKTFTRPERVRKVRHEGEHYRVDAIHLSEPSPQRTPALFQAGTSAKGIDFAAKHAEGVFVGGVSKRVIAPRVAKLRERAKTFGRNPADVLVFMGINVVVAKTEAAAKARVEEYKHYTDTEGALALLSGWTGIDFSTYDDWDEPLKYIKNDAMQSAVEGFTIADPSRVWTLRELATSAGLGAAWPLIVGTPAQVADDLQSWIAETDVDGFNLAYIVSPETFSDFVDLVVPELQRRGVYKHEYAEGTFREKLYGRGKRHLSDEHHGAQFRSWD